MDDFSNRNRVPMAFCNEVNPLEINKHEMRGFSKKSAWVEFLKFSFKPFLALNYKDAFRSPKCNYTQGCQWSPDGTSLLVCSDDMKLRIFKLPSNVSRGEFNDEAWLMGGWRNDMQSLELKESGYIYSYEWYPLMQEQDPISCCVGIACKSMPIHLWNACSGTLISSYLYFNHLDVMVSPSSLAFSPDGGHLVAGYKKTILRAFDVTRPGRHSVPLTSQGQSGIISCVTFHPEIRHLFAAGSYNGSVGLYSLQSDRLLALFEGHSKGVTYMRFSPDGTHLFTGTRKDDEILCWDMRLPGRVLAILNRSLTTNQTMYFDVCPAPHQGLFSGTTDGRVLGWDLSALVPDDGGGGAEVPPSTSFVAHADSVNGISIHPWAPLLATSSGQRRFPTVPLLTGSDCEEKDPATDPINNGEVSTKLWWVGRNLF